MAMLRSFSSCLSLKSSGKSPGRLRSRIAGIGNSFCHSSVMIADAARSARVMTAMKIYTVKATLMPH